MAILDWLTSPRGLALDRHLVRYTGHSLLTHVFPRQAGIEPNPALLLRTQGRKTGLWRDVVLPWFGESNARVVVGSNGGQAADPGWVQNLREHPEAEVFVDRCLQLVVGRFAEGEEYEALWQSICAHTPVYADYQRNCKDSRQIPLVVLEPR